MIRSVLVKAYQEGRFQEVIDEVSSTPADSQANKISADRNVLGELQKVFEGTFTGTSDLSHFLRYKLDEDAGHFSANVSFADSVHSILNGFNKDGRLVELVRAAIEAVGDPEPIANVAEDLKIDNL